MARLRNTYQDTTDQSGMGLARTSSGTAAGDVGTAADPTYKPYEEGGITGGTDWHNDPNVKSGGYTGAGSGGSGGTAEGGGTDAKFDPLAQVGHNDTFNGMNREQWRDAWLGSGTTTLQGEKDWMAKYGGKVLSDNGTALTPFGETMDLLNSAKTGHGSTQWSGVGGGGAAGGGSGSADGTISAPSGFSGYGGGGAGGAGGTGGYAGGTSGLMDILKGLFPNGAFNKDLVNARVSNASDTLNRNRKSQLATTQALLADRGQGTNDGTFGTSAGNLETRLGQGFNQSVNDIYANESGAADDRMIQALQMATGLSQSEAKNAVDYARINSDNQLGWGNIGLGNKNADINKMLGLGNLALGNAHEANNYNLGLGQLGLGRDTLIQNGQNAKYDQLIRLMEQGLTIDQIISGGYI